MEENNYKTATEYGHEFMSVGYKMKKLFSCRSAKSELYHGEFMMLGAIDHMIEIHNTNEANQAGVKVGDIVKWLHGTKSATSKMLRSLEEKNYIERTTSQEDRRAVYIRLTEKGQKIITESKQLMNQFSTEVIQEFGIAEMDELIRLMNGLYAIMVKKTEDLCDEDCNCRQ